MNITAKQAAEHAGRWKANAGQAPHYTAKGFLSTGEWTCYACPLDGCDWHYDDPTDRPDRASHPEAIADAIELEVSAHIDEHDVWEVVCALQKARDNITAVREANNRAWDVVSLHRLRAIHRGEHSTSDPLAQMLSAALVGTPEHEDVRQEVTALSKGVAGAEGIASVPASACGWNQANASLECDWDPTCPTHGANGPGRKP